MTDTASSPGYGFYEKVAESAGRNVTFSFLGLALTWIVASFWLLGAKVLFWIGLALNGFNTMQVLLLTGIGVVAYLGGKRESKWIWAANGTRLVEVALCALVMWLSARIVGYL